MVQEVYEWTMLAEAEKIYTGDNSQVRNMIIERSDKIVSGILTIRKWARYVKREEKDMGVTLDEVDFRPTKDGLSLPLSSLPALIRELQKLEEWGKVRGYIEE